MLDDVQWTVWCKKKPNSSIIFQHCDTCPSFTSSFNPRVNVMIDWGGRIYRRCWLVIFHMWRELHGRTYLFFTFQKYTVANWCRLALFGFNVKRKIKKFVPRTATSFTCSSCNSFAIKELQFGVQVTLRLSTSTTFLLSSIKAAVTRDDSQRTFLAQHRLKLNEIVTATLRKCLKKFQKLFSLLQQQILYSSRFFSKVNFCAFCFVVFLFACARNKCS